MTAPIPLFLLLWLTSSPLLRAHPPIADSLREINAAIRANPASARLYLHRAELHRAGRHFQRALDDLETAAALEPTLAEIDFYRGRALLELGELEDSVAALTRFIQASDRGSSPRHRVAAALWLRSKSHLGSGRRQEAVADLNRAISLAARPGPGLFLTRARILEDSAQVSEAGLSKTAEEQLVTALRGLDEGLDRLGSVPVLVRAAIRLELRLGRIEAALGRLDAMAARAQRQAWLWEERGKLLLVGGREEEARAAFRQALAEIGALHGTRRLTRATNARWRRLLHALEGAPQPLQMPRGELAPRQPDSAGHSSLKSPVVLSAAAASASATRGPYLQRGTSTSVVIRWRTDVATDSWVGYGDSPGTLDQSVSSPVLQSEHEILIEGLEAATKYYYAVGSSAEILSGGDEDHFFWTSVERGERRPLRVWALGDSGTADTNAGAVRDAYLADSAGAPTQVWLMLGDNAYNSGTEGEYQAAVFDMYPSLLRTTSLWPTFGNHDAFSADSDTQSGVYYDSFTLPTGAEVGGLPSGTEAYYSFDHGNVHFICLDSSDTPLCGAPENPDCHMFSWLRDDLDATNQDWIIAYWHHPPYTKGSHDSDSEARLISMRQVFVPELEAHGVDLVLTGHSHSYERSFLLDSHYGTSETLEPAMILDGGDGRADGDGAYSKASAGHAGAVYVVAGSSGKLSNGTLDHPVMFFSVKQLGSVVLDISGGRLSARFLRETGAADDHFVLIKRLPDFIYGDGFEGGALSGWSRSVP